jgi:hypothetical protein
MMLAPVLLFTYNRPAHTQQMLDALQKNPLSRESTLFVFSDGYKNETDRQQVEEVRNVIRSVDGFKDIRIQENAENKGLAANIIEGVTQLVNEYGKVIVLEDDLITSPFFLTFMNDVLNKFEKEEKVGHVHAYCYPNMGLPDLFLIKWTGSWGWGTWKRAWKYFNPDGEYLLYELERRKLTNTFDFNGSYPYTRMLRRQVKGENDSWAIRWNASLFLADILSANAGKSLVQNIGFDGTGTHSGNKNMYITDLYNGKLSTEVSEIKENENARKAFESYYRKTNSFWAKVKRRLVK